VQKTRWSSLKDVPYYHFAPTYDPPPYGTRPTCMPVALPKRLQATDAALASSPAAASTRPTLRPAWENSRRPLTAAPVHVQCKKCNPKTPPQNRHLRRPKIAISIHCNRGLPCLP
jgi:hypothetical protein